MDIILTEKDNKWIKKKYPKLIISNKSIIGEFNFKREYESEVISDKYSVEISLKTNANSILPIVKEVGGRIEKYAKKIDKKNDDFHINPDNTLCLSIHQREREYFTNEKFNIPDFFENILEPYFYWQSHYENKGYAPWGEYAHGELGYLELYAENKIKLNELESNIDIKLLKVISKMKGHHKCLCQSGNILRDCHPLILSAIYKLKKEL